MEGIEFKRTWKRKEGCFATKSLSLSVLRCHSIGTELVASNQGVKFSEFCSGFRALSFLGNWSCFHITH